MTMTVGMKVAATTALAFGAATGVGVLAGFASTDGDQARGMRTDELLPIALTTVACMAVGALIGRAGFAGSSGTSLMQSSFTSMLAGAGLLGGIAAAATGTAALIN